MPYYKKVPQAERKNKDNKVIRGGIGLTASSCYKFTYSTFLKWLSSKRISKGEFSKAYLHIEQSLFSHWLNQDDPKVSTILKIVDAVKVAGGDLTFEDFIEKCNSDNEREGLKRNLLEIKEEEENYLGVC